MSDGKIHGGLLASILGNTKIDMLSSKPRPDTGEKTMRKECPIGEADSARESNHYREYRKLFSAVGTAVWKLEQRMLDPETKEPREEFRKVWRHVEAIKDALAEAGVDIIDWTGKRYDDGMSLKVVSEEEREGTKEAEIVETLLPTIRFRKEVQLQQGEVVVGRPPRENEQ